MRTSMFLALADCAASKITEALSALVACATTGTLLRSPQAWSCSTAAARKVSPAASMTLRPSAWNFFANLPIVVVLPTPLTPTTNNKKGISDSGICRGLLLGFSISCSSCLRPAKKASPSLSCLRSNFSLRFPMIWSVASRPTSAESSCPSTSSSTA